MPGLAQEFVDAQEVEVEFENVQELVAASEVELETVQELVAASDIELETVLAFVVAVASDLA